MNIETRKPTEEYTGLFNTFSDFLSLADNIKSQIRETIRDSLKATGNEITLNYDSVLFHARRR
ncbi:MAG: hypothetical protein JXJ04_14490 [Spirochaetales bacterium]|nr:hypothetical protein [Spirochaetales bacterium]